MGRPDPSRGLPTPCRGCTVNPHGVCTPAVVQLREERDSLRAGLLQLRECHRSELAVEGGPAAQLANGQASTFREDLHTACETLCCIGVDNGKLLVA